MPAAATPDGAIQAAAVPAADLQAALQVNAHAAPAATLPALSPAQHKAALWADASVHVHAVLMGSRIPDLPERLAQAQNDGLLDDHDCLRPGALPPAEQRTAPYLARLLRASSFTDWLLFDAAAGLGDWGVLACSPVRMSALRSHLRSLLQAQLPGGQTIALDWMDPPILQAIVPLFDGAALAHFMGPVQTLVLPGAQAWITVRLSLGRLDMTTVAVAGPR